MRTPADALRDPRPGDVVIVNVRGRIYSRSCIARRGGFVEYRAGKNGIVQACAIPFWQKDIAGVLHVAQEGGEG